MGFRDEDGTRRIRRRNQWDDRRGDGGVARVGVVLGAGGLIGHAYHAGVLAAIEHETGWTPDEAQVLVGTSAGAIVAAMLRAGLPASDLAAMVTGRSLTRAGRAQLDAAGPLPSLPPFRRPRLARRHAPLLHLLRRVRGRDRVPLGTAMGSALPRGRQDLAAVEAWIDRLAPDPWTAGALWICAVRLPTLDRIVWGRERWDDPTVGRAVMASCAIPGYIRPVVHDGYEYVDGAVHSATNADVLAGEDLDLVIAIAPMSAEAGACRRRPDAPVRLLCRRTLDTEVERLRSAGIEVVVFQPCRDDLRVMGWHPMTRAREAATAEIAFEGTRQLLGGPLTGVRDRLVASAGDDLTRRATA